jgi:hypothetical protein
MSIDAICFAIWFGSNPANAAGFAAARGALFLAGFLAAFFAPVFFAPVFFAGAFVAMSSSFVRGETTLSCI